LAAAFIISNSVVQAQPVKDTFFINNSVEYQINRNIFYYKTPLNKTPGYIFDSLTANDFAAVYPKKYLTAGTTDNYYWLLFTVKNNLPDNATFYFELNNPGINVAKVYKRSVNGFQLVGEAGDHLPFGTRPLRYYDLVFPLQLDAGETATIIALLDNTGDNVDCLPQLYDANTFNEKAERYYIVMGAITGIMLTAFILNLFLGITLRDKLHLLYALYVMAMLFEMYILQGIDMQYIYPDKPALSDIFKYLAPATALTLMAFVMQLFLRQTRKNSRLKIMVDLVKYFIILLIPAFLIIYFYFPEARNTRGLYQQVFAITLALQLLLFLLSALEKVWQHYKPAYFYLAAIIYLWYGAIQYVITIMGGDTKEMIEKQPNDLQIGIITETIIVFLGIIYRYNLFKKENQSLLLTIKNDKIKFTEQIISTQEEERKRIAEDLHDELGSNLAAIKLSVQKLPVDKNIYASIINMLDEASADVRNISHNLMPPGFAKTKLGDLLTYYYQQLNNEGNIKFNFHCLGYDRQFSKNDELMIYRILMELTSNIIKHANATESTIQLLYQDAHLEIIAEDNGAGFSATQNPGIGMSSIRSRVDYLAGDMNIDSGNSGTTTIIHISGKK
jgi:signal transduction histidine kinase